MDGSDFRNEWSDFFDREAYDDFGGGMRGLEELDLQGYSQGAMGAGEGVLSVPETDPQSAVSDQQCSYQDPYANIVPKPWTPIGTHVQPAVSDQQCSYQDPYANIVPKPWTPIGTHVQPAVSDQQYSYQDPYAKFIPPSKCLVHPQDRYGQESPYGENSMGLAPFNGDDNMQGVSSDSADHFEPSPKSQGKDVGIKNIDEIFSVTPGKSCFCFLCMYWPDNEWQIKGRIPAIESLTAFSCRFMGCDRRFSKSFPYTMGYHLHCVIRHEKGHFYDESMNLAKKKTFTCKQERCKYSTKRSSDIKRHYAAIHCKNAKKFPCHIIGCKFSGDKGFPRKDKLRDHLKAGHRDMFAPGKPVQTIKPKAGISKAGGNV